MTPQITEGWIQDTVRFLYGFQLRDFQLEILVKILSGGIYSVMMPTDWGKSMSIEMGVILGLALDPTSRNIVVKINENAAVEAGQEIARKLTRLGERYPQVMPKVRWIQGEPVVSKGFYVAGVDPNAPGRQTNKSVRCYGLGSRDLQGKRALRTFVDDLERQEEARSEALSTQLRIRLSAVARTMEDLTDLPNMVWSVWGTPTHARSIHFGLARNLSQIGVRYEEIKVLPTYPDGTSRWPERSLKREIHRRLMDRREYAAAYELTPLGQRNLDDQDWERLKDRRLRIPANERDFRSQLLALDPQNPAWAQRLQALEFYVGWDPAGDGDWAVATVAILGEQCWVLRSHLGLGDTWDQVHVAKTYVEAFPSSITVIERNGTQRSFIDVFEDVMPDQLVVAHGTYGNKDSELIGIPGLMAAFKEGRVVLPWADESESEVEFEVLRDEVLAYSSTSHPHVIPAIWFPWYWSRKHEVKAQRKAETTERMPSGLQFNLGAPRVIEMPETNSYLREQAQRAWGRRL